MIRFSFIAAIIISPVMALGCGVSAVHHDFFSAGLWIGVGGALILLCWEFIRQDLAGRDARLHRETRTLLHTLQIQLDINQMERRRLEKALREKSRSNWR